VACYCLIKKCAPKIIAYIQQLYKKVKRNEIPRLFKKLDLHKAEFLKINLKALKIIQYKSAAIVRIIAQKIAPKNHRIIAPNKPITSQAIIENIQPKPKSSPISPPISPAEKLSQLPTPGFPRRSKLSKTLPRLSLSFQPLYKPIKINRKKTTDNIEVDNKEFK
jgi:hypothetical protein